MRLSQFVRSLICAGTVLFWFQTSTVLAQPDASSPGKLDEPLIGTWSVELGGQTGTIIVTPTGQVYLVEQSSNGGVRALELGRIVQKLSPTAQLPPNAQVLSLIDQFKQQANRAKQSEAKQYIGAITRSEQAFFLEKDRFTANLDELEIGIKPETQNYRYRIFLFQRPGMKRGLEKAVWAIALSKQPDLKSYVSVVWLEASPGTAELFSSVTLCESNKPTMQLPPPPTFPANKQGPANCPPGFSRLDR